MTGRRLLTVVFGLILAGVPAWSAVETRTLPSGAIVAVEGGNPSRIFAVHVLLRNRAAAEPAGKEGLVDLAQRMLAGGTARRTKADLDRALEAIGAQLKTVDEPMIPFDDYYSVPEFSFARFQTIDIFHREGLRLLAEMMFEPRLDEENLDRSRRALAEIPGREGRNPRGVGQQALLRRLFKQAWKSRSIYGSEASLALIGLDVVKGFWPTYFEPANMIWTIQTNLPADQVLAEVEQLFAAFPAKQPGERTDLIPAAIWGTEAMQPAKVALGAKQGYVWAGDVFQLDGSEQPALAVLVSLFSDAMAMELREKRGLAYSLGAELQTGNDGRLGAILISLGTRPANLEAARSGIQEQMNLFARAKTSPEDLAVAVNRIKGRALMRWIPSLSRSYYMGLSLLQGQPTSAYRQKVLDLDRVTPEDLERVKARYFRPGGYRWVLVE